MAGAAPALLDAVTAVLRDAGASFTLVFGSRARGDARPDSDLDVAAWWPGESPAPWTVALPDGVDLGEQLAPILAAVTVDGIESNAAFEELLTSSPAAAFDAVRGGLTIDRSALAELRDLEIRASDADLECGTDMTETMREVRWSYEKEFVATHEAALIEARAGLNPS